MKFSVLMSVYYKENPDFLKTAIDSVLNQTLKPNEIVIVRDGKLTEELDVVLDAFSEKYPKIINIVSLEKNSGLGIALNYGLSKCKYDLVARMDSDDISDNKRFEQQIACFKRNPDLSMVGGLIKEFDVEIDDLNRIRAVPENNNDIYTGLKKRNCINHVTVMFRKSDILEAGGYQDCPYFEDYYLWCRVATLQKKLYNVQNVLVYVRAGNDMINRRGGLKYFCYSRDFYKKILKINYISLPCYYFNIFVRFVVALAPSGFRSWFYSKFLRKKEG